MAYVIIPNADVDAESPITESLMTQLRDNPEAIAVADAGTSEPPRIQVDQSSISAICATNASEGEVLTVVNEVNPNTGQGGLLVRPRAGGQSLITGNSVSGDPGNITRDLNLDDTGKWLVTAWSYQWDNSTPDPLRILSYSCRYEAGVVVDTEGYSVLANGGNGPGVITFTDQGGGTLRVVATTGTGTLQQNRLMTTSIRFG